MIRRMLSLARSLSSFGEAMKASLVGGSSRALYDRKTMAYSEHLGHIARDWRRRSAGKNLRDPGVRNEAGWDFLDDMLASSELYIPEAFGLGFGDQPMNYQDTILRDTLVGNNNNAIRMRLGPFVLGLLETAAGGDDYYEELGPIENRADLYVGAYWSAIWTGLGAGLGNLLPSIPVRRLLNPIAEHCGTCPPKAGEYSSWTDMLSYCGGLPGDGSDECRSRCRCRLEFMGAGVWREEFEF